MKKNFIKPVSVITVGSILSKVLGFGRETVIAYYFGASAEVDAYLISVIIPIMLTMSLSVGISNTLIPFVTEYIVKGNNSCKCIFFRKLIKITILFGLIVSVLGILFSNKIIRLIAPGFNDLLYINTVRMTQIAFISTVFIFLISIITGFLQAHKYFFIPSLSAVPYNFGIIIGTIVGGIKNNVFGIIIGTVAGILMQLIMLSIGLKKIKIKFNVNEENYSNKNIKQFFIVLLPVVISSGVQQFNTLVDRVIASKFSHGIISALNYANRLNLLPYSIIIMAVATVMLSNLSELASKQNILDMKVSTIKTLKLAVCFIIPICIIFISFNESIVKIIFQRGAFTYEDTKVTALCLSYYSLGLIGLSIRELLSRLFYANKNTKIPMLTGIVSVFINIFLSIILSYKFGFIGIPLATSVSLLITAGMIFKLAETYYGKWDINWKTILLFGIKLFITLVFSLLAIILFKYLFLKECNSMFMEFMIILLSSVLFIIIFYFMLVYFKIIDLKEYKIR